MNPIFTRIATLLASGLKATQVSTIVGVSPSRIAQISATEEFKTILEGKMAETKKGDEEEVAIAAKYLSAEHLLINQILDMAPSSELRDVTNALKVVSERQLQRSKIASSNGTAIHTNIVSHQIVQITMPVHALPEYYLSPTREVLSIDNQNLAPLSSSGVTSLFSSLREAKQEELENRYPDLEIEEPTSSAHPHESSAHMQASPSLPSPNKKPSLADILSSKNRNKELQNVS